MTIESETGFFIHEGENFQLTCSVDRAPFVSVHFLHRDDKLLSNERMLITKFSSGTGDKTRTYIKLTVFKVDKQQDAGEYKCVAYDNEIKPEAKVVKLILIEEMPTNFTQKIDLGICGKQFALNFTAYPSAVLNLYDETERHIATDEDVRYPAVDQVFMNSTWYRFSLKTPKVKDSANFTLVLRTVDELIKYSFELIIQGD